MVLKKDDKNAKKPKAKVWVKPKPAPEATPVLVLESKPRYEIEQKKNHADVDGEDNESEEPHLLTLKTTEVCLYYFFLLPFAPKSIFLFQSSDDEDEDGSGPSSGRRPSSREREENLTELWRLQRILLLRGRRDRKEGEEEGDVEEEGEGEDEEEEGKTEEEEEETLTRCEE